MKTCLLQNSLRPLLQVTYFSGKTRQRNVVKKSCLFYQQAKNDSHLHKKSKAFYWQKHLLELWNYCAQTTLCL